MTDADRERYREAFTARKMAAERIKHQITHCRYVDGLLYVLTIPKAGAEPPVELQGSFL